VAIHTDRDRGGSATRRDFGRDLIRPHVILRALPPVTADQIGPYRIVQRLGAGGMGEVFLAEDTRLGRKVALKTLSASGDSQPAETRRKLLREARAAAKLNHPNIAAVYDVVETADEAHIVMEYVPGETLAQRLANGPLSPGAVVDLGIQIADALVDAHAAGVVHRDLKPANIAMGPGGKPKILDFGLAHNRTLDLSGSTGPLSVELPGAPRVVVGTPHYMPPELLLGHSLDERGDIYSLGVTLFELLTGQRPYVGADTGAVAMNVLRAPMPRVRDLRPDVMPDLDALVAQAMARRPADRHPSAAALRDALQRVATAPVEIPTHPMVLGRAMPDWLGRRAAVIAATAVLALAVAGVARNRAAVPVAPAISGPQVIAILPLRGEGTDAQDDVIGAGVADVLASALSKVSGITVLPRSATLSENDAREAPLAMAHRVGASMVVDGRVMRAGDRVRLVAQLMRADTGAVAWSETYEATEATWFDVQPRVAEDLARALRPDITAAERGRVKESVAADPAAFADFAQAWTYLERFDVPGNLDHAIALFQSAIGKGPRFARAHAGLGDAYWRKFRATGDDRWAAPARDAITEALRLDPDDPSVHYALAVLFRDTGRPREAKEEAEAAIRLQPDFDLAHALLGDLLAESGTRPAAEAAYKRAIALRPGYWSHHLGLGVFYFSIGRVDDAITAFRRVTELRPDSSWGYQMIGMSHHALGRLKEAVPFYEQALRIAPDAPAYSNLGTAYYQLGRLNEARAAYVRAIALEPADPLKHRNLGDLHRRAGDEAAARREYAEALRLARRRLEINPRDARALALAAVIEAKTGDIRAAESHAAEALALSPASSEVVYKVAVVHALAGRTDQALEMLDKAMQMGFRAWEARVDDDLAGLRTNARFVSLTSRKEAS
jgi:serine/threonine-protein kinase